MNNAKAVLTFGLAVLTLLFTFDATHAQQSRDITLAGYKMNPTVGTTGTGFVTVSLHRDTLSVEGEFSELMSPFSGAYIMGEIRGEAGNVLYRLKADLNEEKKGGQFKRKKNTFVLSKAQKAMLREGKLHLTITSREHSNGEIRAKIPPMSG